MLAYKYKEYSYCNFHLTDVDVFCEECKCSVNSNKTATHISLVLGDRCSRE